MPDLGSDLHLWLLDSTISVGLLELVARLGFTESG